MGAAPCLIGGAAPPNRPRGVRSRTPRGAYIINTFFLFMGKCTIFLNTFGNCKVGVKGKAGRE